MTAFAIVVLFGFFLFRGTLAGQLLLLALLQGVSLIALWEYRLLVQRKNLQTPYFLLASFSCVFLVLSYLVARGCLPGSLLVAPFLIYLLFLFYLRSKEHKGAIVYFALSSFPLLYIVLPTSSVLFLLYTPLGGGNSWFFYLIAVTKCSDIAAYLGGNALGRHPLSAKISPKKTQEGAGFGILGALVCSLFLTYFAKSMPAFEGVSYIKAALLGVFLALLGQIGDLFESLLKRDAQVKDSNQIRGIGGALDLIDSLLFTAPALFCILWAMR